MRIRLGLVGLLSLFLAFGCDNAADGPSGTNTGPGSISGSYNPDGVVAVISGQVLLQAASEGAHGDTRVAVQGYASTAVTNAEGMFRLELILSEEDITRSDEDADGSLTVEVVFSHPGYTPSQMRVTVAPGEAVALDETVTLEVILATVRGRLAFPVGLNPADFAEEISLSLTPSAGAAPRWEGCGEGETSASQRQSRVQLMWLAVAWCVMVSAGGGIPLKPMKHLDTLSQRSAAETK